MLMNPYQVGKVRNLQTSCIASSHLGEQLLLLLLLLLQIDSSDADTPWFCCLHPNPDLASCLIPEEQHDGNSSSTAALHDDEAGTPHLSYSSMPGFLPAADAAKFAAPLSGSGATAAGGASPHHYRMRSTAAAAADADGSSADELQQLHESNVAHFSAVFNSLPEFGDVPALQQLALWLSDQRPAALAAGGVSVPRDIVKDAPDYGERAVNRR
jgi:hypothetical protein